MENSDSETESECFESAEESVDEDENNVTNTKSTDRLQGSESVAEVEVQKTFDSQNDISVQREEEFSSNSLSYRKRPERFKRSQQPTLPNVISKKPSSELIFKKDNIVSDVFIQDLTSNLSKNINKSLSSLQQTSSNVKDLILNSLPVPSANENKGFSYDEPCDDTSAPAEEVSQSDSDFSNDKVKSNFEEKEKLSAGEPTSFIADSLKDIKEKQATPDLEVLNVEKEVKKISVGHNSEDKVDNNTINKIGENKSDLTENKTEEILETANSECIQNEDIKNSENESNQKVQPSEICSENENSELCPKLKPEPQNVDEETIQVKEDKFLNQENISSLKLQVRKVKCNEPEIEEEFLQTPESSDPSNEGSSLTSENIEKTLNVENSETNKHISSNENKIDLKCSEKDLKADTETDEVTKTDEKNYSSSKFIEIEKEQSSEEKVEVKQSQNEGWDDFDFSDTENEGSQEDSSSKNFEKEKSIDRNLSEKGTANNLKNNNIKSENSGSMQGSETSQKNNESLPEDKVSEVDDNWDWNAWDEAEEENKVEVPTKENFSSKEETDLSNWSGWDKFGQKQTEKQGNWSLGSWGMDMLLNKATAVTQGISNVLEAGLGVPDPETLAKMDKIEKKNFETYMEEKTTPQEQSNETSKKNSLTDVNIFPVSGLTSLVAGVTSKIVEHSKIQEIGSKVITGGLDTLETFGKKTMEVLQEGDPGLKNKRAFLSGGKKPVLSQVLKEAREKADREMKREEEKNMAKRCHFETLFDDYQGMIHLEALEMLSKQCELKLEQIKNGMNSEEQEELNGILEEVEQLCSLDDYDDYPKSTSSVDFRNNLQMAVEPIKTEISVQTIIQIHEGVSKWLQDFPESNVPFAMMNQKLVSTLAELTAAAVHQFHKSGELLSIKECRKTVEEVDALSRLTNILCTEINTICDQFVSLAQKMEKKESNDKNISTENFTSTTMNSTSYIKQAFNLLIPVLQLGAAV